VFCVVSACDLLSHWRQDTFARQNEKHSRFVGNRGNKGAASKFKVLTDESNEVVNCSLVCNADYPKHPYARLFLEWVELGWISFAVIEDKLSGEIVDKIVNTFVETKYAF